MTRVGYAHTSCATMHEQAWNAWTHISLTHTHAPWIVKPQHYTSLLVMFTSDNYTRTHTHMHTHTHTHTHTPVNDCNGLVSVIAIWQVGYGMIHLCTWLLDYLSYYHTCAHTHKWTVVINRITQLIGLSYYHRNVWLLWVLAGTLSFLLKKCLWLSPTSEEPKCWLSECIWNLVTICLN